MTTSPPDFEAIFRHCLAITSSLELDEVATKTVAALEELMPSTSVTLSFGAPRRPHGTDQNAVTVPLEVANEALGALHVIPGDAPLSAADRTRIAAMVPTIASAVRNAMFLARQRVSWDNQRALDREKSRFIRLAASGLDGPLHDVSELVDELQREGGRPMRATASDLVARTRFLADHIEEILRLSSTQNAGAVLPEI